MILAQHPGHEHVSPSATFWQTDAFSVVGTVLVVAVAVAYLAAASRSSGTRDGRTWPAFRTALFMTGLILLAVTLFSGLTASQHTFAIHIAQCMVVMMVVVPLVVAGAPLRLLLATLPSGARSAVTDTARDPLVRRFSTGRSAAVLLTVDYYGSMALFVLTPLYRWSTEYLWLHIAAHVYFLLCGLVFWAPLLGEDLAGWRPSRPVALVMTAVGVPANVVVGAMIVSGISSSDGSDTAGLLQAGWVYAVLGVALSVLGAGLAWSTSGGRHGGRFEKEMAWPAAS